MRRGFESGEESRCAEEQRAGACGGDPRGLLALAGIRNPRRRVRCQDCAGGQLAGQPVDTARERPPLAEAPQPAAV